MYSLLKQHVIGLRRLPNAHMPHQKWAGLGCSWMHVTGDPGNPQSTMSQESYQTTNDVGSPLSMSNRWCAQSTTDTSGQRAMSPYHCLFLLAKCCFPKSNSSRFMVHVIAWCQCVLVKLHTPRHMHEGLLLCFVSLVDIVSRFHMTCLWVAHLELFFLCVDFDLEE